MADPGYYFAPEADIFTPIAALLEEQTGFKSYFQEKSHNHLDTRWDWMPTDGAFAGPKMTGDAPRLLADVDFRCEIACRAKTHDEAWKMAQQLVSASRRIKFASGVVETWKIADSSDQAATLKTVLVLTMVWSAPFLEQALGNETERKTIKSADFDKTSPDYGVDDTKLIAPSG